MTMKTNKVLTRFTHSIALVALALALCLTTSPARATPDLSVTPVRLAAQTEGLTDPKELEAFLAPLLAELMEAKGIPGGAIAVVKDGQLFFAQGYGYADLERRIPATADGTVFRAGSIAKVFTWTAVMQLVEQGKLDLKADVNTYLTHFQIPATFPQPITLAHLMTHTAGFEDQIVNATLYAPAEGYRPLPDFLADKMPARIFPPGQIVAYSNYGTALAGEIVAEVSGEPFEQYIATHILQPLEMNHSTFLQPLPSELAPAAAVGYAIDEEGLPHPGPFEFILVRPAGALSVTATDMAHFMIAHLQDGRYGDGRILQAASAQDMRRQYYAFHPRLPGMTRGFAEAYRNDIHLVFHMGTTDRSSSLLALLPNQNLGIFLTFNSYITAGTRQMLLNALLDHYYPVSPPPAVRPPADFSQRAASFSGSYLSTQRAETNWGKLAAFLFAKVSVSANPDGTLIVDAFSDNKGVPKRWVEVAPLVFQEVGGQSHLAFSADEQGRITAMFNGDQPILAFQKVAWYEDPLTHLIGLGLALLVFLATGVIWSLGALSGLVRRNVTALTPLERWGRPLASGLILVNLVVAALIISVLVGDERTMQFGYPTGLTIAGLLALASSTGALAVLAWIAGAWWQGAWGLLGRLHYTLVAVAALYFVWYLNEVNLFL
jgi:CubicO group peptidase (beta-lactamase class C family)